MATPINSNHGYIFAYGSLLRRETRLGECSALGDAQPARLQGYARGWFVTKKNNGIATLYLGIRPSFFSQPVNGLIYPVDAQLLCHADRLECGSYKRILLPEHAFEWLDPYGRIPGGVIWAYVPSNENADEPTGNSDNNEAIVMPDYLETCLQGCEEIELDFAFTSGYKAEFIRSTHWTPPASAALMRHIHSVQPLSSNPYALRSA